MKSSVKNVIQKSKSNQVKKSIKLKTTPSNKSSISPIKKKVTNKQRPHMKDLKPCNLEMEKLTFFGQFGNYNPQFEYVEKNQELFQSAPHLKYKDIALKILQASIKEFGSEENYCIVDGGRLITKEETEIYFNEYISKLGVQEYITYEFHENTIAPTSVVHNAIDGTSKVIIGLPVNYRIHRIEGVLNHEIGTHFIRKINDKQQPWFKKRGKYKLEPYLKNEEGLAVLNQMHSNALVPYHRPYLFMAALHYISAIMASRMGFAQLYQELQYFIQDDQKRFRECLRVKRGMKDTSQVGGMYKDQVYLRGAIKVLKYRHNLNYTHLHSGKITVKDCIRLGEKGLINTNNVRLPHFLHDITSYKKALDNIATINFLQ